MIKNKPSFGILIRELKYEVEKLTISNGNLSRLHLFALGLLGAGIGAAGLFLRLGDIRMGNLLVCSPKREATSKSLWYVAGLRNLGNNCFFNVILQALASCGCFFSYLEDLLNTVNLESKESVDEMPLTVALVSLLNDLQMIRGEAIVLNPRKVMIAMGLYLTSFSLTRQQDAAEAFVHLMSSLEDELLDSYMPYYGSLADITVFGNDVSFIHGDSSNLRQWQNLRFGPFDGIIGSMLVCANCSLQLSLDLEIFRCLPLSPIREDCSISMDCSTLEDCLRKLTAVERLESNHCGRCWHNMALKYLSSRSEENMEKIKVIQSCFNQDSCECANLLHDEVTWFGGSSHTLKQLWIAQCPKILCLHLLRASINSHGDVIKVKGHVTFPLVLDLSAFTNAVKNVTCRSSESNSDFMPLRNQLSFYYSTNSTLPLELPRMQYFSMNVKQQLQLSEFAGNNLELPTYKLADDISDPLIRGHGSEDHNEKSKFTDRERPVPTELSNSHAFSSSEHLLQVVKTSTRLHSDDLKRYKYGLVSVIEHYGTPGTGHYAVYKKLGHSTFGDSIHEFDKPDQNWYYISDSNVSRVTVEEVLSSEASLLFYERID